MRKVLAAVVLMLVCTSAGAQQIAAMSIDEVIKRASSKDTVYIVNFWATWCAPCVEELPVFNALEKRYAGKPVKVLLVSLDFKEYYPMKLGTFLQRKKITPEVIWLTDTNPNEYIPKVSKAWEGSIPATVVVHTGKQVNEFIEGQVTERQIARIVDGLVK